MKKPLLKLRLLPVIVYTAFVLLLLRAHSYYADINDIPNIPIDSTTELWDVFGYVKSSAILFIAIWAAFSMAYLLITGTITIKKTYIYIPMLIYTLGVVVSYLMSDYKLMAWNGCVGRFEGTRTILCYMFLLFYTINVVDELRDAVIIIIAAVLSIFIACLIGMTQLVEHDIFLTDIANYIITGGGGFRLRGEFEPGQVYQTVFNMNYVGMYLALIIPVLIYVLIYLYSKKNTQSLLTLGIDKKKRTSIAIFTGLLLVMIALNVYGASSTGGVIGICVSIVVMLMVLCDKKIIKITLAVLMIVGTLGAFALIYKTGVDTHRQIGFIETGLDYVKMSIDGNEICVNYDRTTGNFEVYDGDNNPIRIFMLESEPGRYHPDDDRFSGRVFFVPLTDENGEVCIIISARDNDIEYGFTFHEDGVKYLNPFGEEVSLGRIDSIGFENHLSSGSGRGFIWSRTLPLLKDRIFKGSGADTLMLVFPQDDYAGKCSAGIPLQNTCDKAHNMYLHMAVGTGVVSMIAFLTMIGMVMWRTFNLGKDKTFVKIIATGVIGFLFAGIFNDSSVCTMPMFYGMLGTVIALNN